ncbi:hypothetical protein WG66_016673 [Moniliophthora roreri]|uniref:Uncharacterized protein n=1 Tax=Moniliophthora roreri TaxID=221103 RepID=A0A0W0F0I2_MONRR|nr:hypothetical protein WG66_016673 [Moniliophthora roreri]
MSLPRFFDVRAEEQPSPGTPTEPKYHLDATTPQQSEEASLHGQKAKTPIIAGSICGAVLGLAWIIGLFIYIRKRYNRKMRKRAAVAAGEDPEQTNLKRHKNAEPAEKIIIPPDPAVLLGQGRPGEHVYPEKRRPSENRRKSNEPRVTIPEHTLIESSPQSQENSNEEDESGHPGTIPRGRSSTSNS